MLLPSSDLSRRDTTLCKTSYLLQLPLDAEVGTRRWVHRMLRLRIAESRQDCALVADIVKRRHYRGAWPAPPGTLILKYLADFAGVTPGPAGAAGMVMVALLPAAYHVIGALDLHRCEVLTLCRMWRADDLGPAVAPDLSPELLRRVVRGERSRGPLRGVRDEWLARKCRNLRAVPRLLATYADPARGHDGATYLAAGALSCGPGRSGKLLFAWGLDADVQQRLERLAEAVKDRRRLAG
jgi:hypothetical protein